MDELLALLSKVLWSTLSSILTIGAPSSDVTWWGLGYLKKNELTVAIAEIIPSTKNSTD